MNTYYYPIYILVSRIYYYPVYIDATSTCSVTRLGYKYVLLYNIIHARARAHTHTYTHKHTHARTHTHAHTHAHKHTDWCGKHLLTSVSELQKRTQWHLLPFLLLKKGYCFSFAINTSQWRVWALFICERDLLECQKRPIRVSKETY